MVTQMIATLGVILVCALAVVGVIIWQMASVIAMDEKKKDYDDE